MQIQTIPAGFLPHDDDSSRYGYPAGVDHQTRVDVIISYAGCMYLRLNKPAANFGWQIDPHAPSCPGLQSVSAPITHYRICEGA